MGDSQISYGDVLDLGAHQERHYSHISSRLGGNLGSVLPGKPPVYRRVYVVLVHVLIRSSGSSLPEINEFVGSFRVAN